jgi:hypothetical protein
MEDFDLARIFQRLYKTRRTGRQVIGGFDCPRAEPRRSGIFHRRWVGDFETELEISGTYCRVSEIFAPGKS